MKTPETQEQFIEQMDIAFGNVVAAYKDFVRKSDVLANSMGFYQDWTLGKLLPKTADKRRDHSRFDEWFEREKPNAIAHFISVNEQRRAKQKRDDLLARLNLTEEQMELLGIKEP